jgi:hypothetical protein
MKRTTALLRRNFLSTSQFIRLPHIAWLTLLLAALVGSAAAERPSFRNVETQLTGFSVHSNGSLNIKDKFAGSLSGSTVFGERFFLSGSLGFGSSIFGNSSAVSLGILKGAGDNSVAFAAIGAQRYNYYSKGALFGADYRSDRFSTATATIGIRSMLSERIEGTFGLTALDRGPYRLQATLKGTYYFTDNIGGVLEFGSSDGDRSGGMGVRFNF